MKSLFKTVLLTTLAVSFSLHSRAASTEMTPEEVKLAAALAERVAADYKELSAKGEDKSKLEDFSRFQELYAKYAEQQLAAREERLARLKDGSLTAEEAQALELELKAEEVRAAASASADPKEAEVLAAQAKELEAKLAEVKAAEAKAAEALPAEEKAKAEELAARTAKERASKGLQWSLEKDGNILQCLEDGKLIAEFKTANLLSGLPEEYLKKLESGAMSGREVLSLVKLCAEARATVDGIKFADVAMVPVRDHAGPKYEDPSTTPVIPGSGLDGTGLEHSAPGAPAPPLPLILAFGVAAIAKFRKGVRRVA